MKHWVFVANYRNWQKCHRHGSFGVSEKYVEAWKKIDEGDLTTFYVTGKKQFRGLYKVGQRFIQQTPLWEGSLPYRIRISCFLDRAVPIDEIFDALLFITNRGGRGAGGWSDHFQFSVLSIRGEDFETISVALEGERGIDLPTNE